LGKFEIIYILEHKDEKKLRKSFKKINKKDNIYCKLDQEGKRILIYSYDQQEIVEK